MIFLYYRWSKKESSSQSLSAYISGNISCSALEPQSKLKCSGSTLGLKNLHGRWGIRCRPCILLCLSVEAKKFWFDVGKCFSYVLLMFWYMYIYVFECQYHHKLSYKAPISVMVVILSCCHDFFLLSRAFVVNTATS